MERRQDKGAVVWLTGRPSAGKSTMAESLRDAMARRGIPHVLLDGDQVRSLWATSPGYDPEGREAFYTTLARLAAMLARQGLVVLVAATAHRRAFRDLGRELAPRFVEVYVATPLEECRRRDDKGLYRKSEHGEVGDLPGAGQVYEEPLRPEVTAAGGKDQLAIDHVLSLV